MSIRQDALRAARKTGDPDLLRRAATTDDEADLLTITYRAKAWAERLHPRDRRGRFARGIGVGTEGLLPPPPRKRRKVRLINGLEPRHDRALHEAIRKGSFGGAGRRSTVISTVLRRGVNGLSEPDYQSVHRLVKRHAPPSTLAAVEKLRSKRKGTTFPKRLSEGWLKDNLSKLSDPELRQVEDIIYRAHDRAYDPGRRYRFGDSLTEGRWTLPGVQRVPDWELQSAKDRASQMLELLRAEHERRWARKRSASGG